VNADQNTFDKRLPFLEFVVRIDLGSSSEGLTLLPLKVDELSIVKNTISRTKKARNEA